MKVGYWRTKALGNHAGLEALAFLSLTRVRVTHDACAALDISGGHARAPLVALGIVQTTAMLEAGYLTVLPSAAEEQSDYVGSWLLDKPKETDPNFLGVTIPKTDLAIAVASR